MGWIFGKKKKKEEEGKKQSSAVTAYEKDFKPLQRTKTKADDRKGKKRDNVPYYEPAVDDDTFNKMSKKEKAYFIEMTDDELENTRFYGASNARGTQMEQFGTNVAQKRGTNKVKSKSVDNLNQRIGITGQFFSNYPPTLRAMRDGVAKAIFDNAVNNEQDEEAKEWGRWLAEESRFTALLMPEMNGEFCRREMKLDDGARESLSDAEQIKTTEKEENVQRIDYKKHRIYVGDKKRMDNLSHWINSGQTRDIDGEKYEIYWVQESYGVDALKTSSDAKEQPYYTWTPEMKKLHDESLKEETDKVQGKYDGLKEIFKKQYLQGNSNKKDLETDAEKYAENCKRNIMFRTYNWVKSSIQNRFFRLTSLMGLDFFNNRGNTIQFARDIGQENYDGAAVNRVITDSEWAHAQRMGYTGKKGHVHRVNTTDRFRLRQQ